MRTLVTLSLMMTAQILYPSMYTELTLLQGHGSNVEEAERDALTALPEGWKKDPRNSQQYEHLDGNETRITIPIVREDVTR